MPLVTVAVSLAAGTLPYELPSYDRTRSIRPRAGLLRPAMPAAAPALPQRAIPQRQSTSADVPRMQQSEQHLRQIASTVLTYRLNAHKLPRDLGDFFRARSLILRSPFDPQGTDGYAHLPANITGRWDDRVIFYDRAELDVLGTTQAITNSFQILKVTPDDLIERHDLSQ